MKLDDLDFLKELDHLRRIRAEAAGAINTSELERDFLAFSQATGHSITVKKPRSYRLSADEKKKYAEALATYGLAGLTGSVDGISVSGDSDGSMHDKLVLVSIKQVGADHFSILNSYLNPLIEKVMTDGASMVRDFSIHEAITGSVSVKRGDLDLKEAHLFPNRFTKGHYTLEAALDTPSNGITSFVALKGMLEQLGKNPFPSLLDPKHMGELTKKGVALRSKYGALARYETPRERSFSAQANAAYLKIGGTELFYLHNPGENDNTVVFFGDDLFHSKYRPDNLTILNGKDYQFTLSELASRGYFIPSEAVLAQRITDLKEARDAAIRAKGLEAKGSAVFTHLLEELENAKSYLSTVRNPDMRAGYFAKKEPEILEFAVVPKDNNPLLHALLPRLSWNKTVREYHDTESMKKRLELAGDEEKKEILASLSSTILFRNQQNYELNAYIEKEYGGACKGAGVEIRHI